MNYLTSSLGTILFANWKILLLRGGLALIFGLLTWFQPVASLAAIVLLLGAFFLADGVLGLWMAVSGRKTNEDWWILLLWALIGLGAGILTLKAPGATALVILFYVAAWAIATGVLQIVAAIRLRKEIEGEWWFILSGVLSVVLGVLLMAQPGEGILALIWLVGTYAVIFGVLLILLALKVRKHPVQEANDQKVQQPS